MRIDKKKVTDEVWDDARVRSFLTPRPVAGDDSEGFGLLLNAYQGMRPADFQRFVEFFVAAGHDLDAANASQETFVEYISTHRHAGPFIEIVSRAQSGSSGSLAPMSGED